ncbi:zinc finger protein, putative, partial [Plasmodium sp. DRC-Itaito]
INHYNTIRESNYDFKSALNVQFCKTKMCPYMNTKEKCKRFSNNMCPYAHDKSELKPIPNLYKTAMCRNFIKNMCFKSKKECNFAHHVEELRSTDEFYKTTLCKFFLNGYCKADKNCRHAHGYKELKRRPTNNMNMMFICGSKMNHNDMDTKKDIIDKEIMNNSDSSESVSLNENRRENLPRGDENELIVDLKESGEDENHLDVNKEDDMLNMRNTSKNNKKRDDYYNNSCKFMSISTKDTCCFISKNNAESSGDEEMYRSKSECSNDVKEEDEEKAEKKKTLKLKEESHNGDIKCIHYINDDELVKNDIELRGEDGKYTNKNYQSNISEEKEKIKCFKEEEKDTHINMEYRCDSIVDDESNENIQSEKFIRNTCLPLDGVESDDEKNESNEDNVYENNNKMEDNVYENNNKMEDNVYENNNKMKDNVYENNNKMKDNVLFNNNSNEDIMNLQEEKFEVVSVNGDVKSYITYNHKMNHITKYHRNVDYDRKYFNNEGVYKSSFYYIKLNENRRYNYNNHDTNHADNEYDNNYRGKDNNHFYNYQKKKNYNNEYNKNVYKNRKVFNIKTDNIRQKDEENRMINDNDFNNKNGYFFDINKGISNGSILYCPIKYNNSNSNDNNSNNNNNNNNSDNVKRYLSNNENISNNNVNNNSNHIVNLNNYNNIGMNQHVYNNTNEINNYNYYGNYHCYNNINDSTSRYMNNNNSNNNNNNNINYNNTYYFYYKNMKHGNNYEGTISTATTINNNHYNNNYIYEHSLSDISNIMAIPYRSYPRDKKDFSEHGTFLGKRNNSHMPFNNDIKDMEDDNMLNDISINRKAHNINVQKWIHGIHSNNKFNDTHNNNNNNNNNNNCNNNYNNNGNIKGNIFNNHGEIDCDHNCDDDFDYYEENNYLYDNIHNNIKGGNTLSENLNLRKTCSYDGEFFNDKFSHRTCSYERNNKENDDMEGSEDKKNGDERNEQERNYNETYFKYNDEKSKSTYNLKEKDIYVSNSKYINNEKNKHYDMYSHNKRSRGISSNLRNDNVKRDIYREEECNIWNEDLHVCSIKKLNDLKRKENEYNMDDYYNCVKEEIEEREDEKGKENGKERNDKDINFHINKKNEHVDEEHLTYHYIPGIQKVNTHNTNHYPIYDKIIEHYNNKYNWLYHRTSLLEPMDISYAEKRHVMEPILTYEKEKMGNILFSNNNSSIYFVGNEKNIVHDNIHNKIYEEEDETSNDDLFNKELQTCVSCYQYIKEKIPSNKIFIESTCLNCGQFIRKSLCLILIELLKPQVQNILSDVSFYEQCYND